MSMTLTLKLGSMIPVVLLLPVGWMGCGSPSFVVLPDEAPDTGAVGPLDTGAMDTGPLSTPDGPGTDGPGTEAFPDAAIEVADTVVPDPGDAETGGSDASAGDVCASPHANGLGQGYAACAPTATPGDASTYSSTLARAARAAWPEVGVDGEGACSTPGAPLYVWRRTATACAGWVYTGPAAGHVYLGTLACSCPGDTHPTWN